MEESYLLVKFGGVTYTEEQTMMTAEQRKWWLEREQKQREKEAEEAKRQQ